MNKKSTTHTMTRTEVMVKTAQSMGWVPDRYTYSESNWVDLYKSYSNGERYCLHLDGDSMLFGLRLHIAGFKPMAYAIEQYQRNRTATIREFLVAAIAIEDDLKELADALDTCMCDVSSSEN